MAFTRIFTKDPNVDRNMELVQVAVRELEKNPLTNARQFDNVALSVVPYDLHHGLKRVPVGVVVARADSGAGVYETTWTRDVVTLVATANVTVSLLVY